MTQQREHLRVCIVQPSLKLGDREGNLQKIEQLIDKQKKVVDLFVLPEIFSTGFTSLPQSYAEPVEECKTLEWMKSIAKKKQCAIVGTTIVIENEKYYNRCFFVYPDGEYKQYDKYHLYKMGHENKYFSNGTKRVQVEYKGWKILLATCYDLRFPAWLRNAREEKDRYEVIIFCCAWSSENIRHFMTLTSARAIENQSFVIASNNCGTLPDTTLNGEDCVYTGDCRLIDPFGIPFKISRSGVVETVYGELDYSLLENWRKEFPVLDDMDDFEIKSNN